MSLDPFTRELEQAVNWLVEDCPMDYLLTLLVEAGLERELIEMVNELEAGA